MREDETGPPDHLSLLAERTFVRPSEAPAPLGEDAQLLEMDLHRAGRQELGISDEAAPSHRAELLVRRAAAHRLRPGHQLHRGRAPGYVRTLLKSGALGILGTGVALQALGQRRALQKTPSCCGPSASH